MYKIKYFYETGNSFGREDCTEILELEWNDLEIARTALSYINEHWEFYSEYKRYSISDAERKKLIRSVKDKPWFIEGKYESFSSLLLPTDEGKDYMMSAPWCGYFETLYGAEIVLDSSRDRIKTK